MNESRMSKKPVLVTDEGVEALVRIPLTSRFFSEAWLQDVLEREPSVLPAGYVDQVFAPLLFIAREVSVDSNAIDLLFLSAKGYLVVVETKLWRNPDAKRKVVSQIIDYAKDIRDWDYKTLDGIYREAHAGKPLFSAMVEAGYQKQEDEAYFVDIVENNIKKARFLLMIAGDGIRGDVEKMVGFLNDSVQLHYQFALCELEVYELGDGKRLIVPQLTTRTQVVTRTLFDATRPAKAIPEIEPRLSASASAEMKVQKRKYMDAEDWASHTVFKQVTAEEILEFTGDLEDLGFTLNPGTADLAIDYKSEQYQKTMKLLKLFHNGDTGAVHPKSIFTFLEQTGYSRALGEKFLDEFGRHLLPNPKGNPLDSPQRYFYFKLRRLVTHKEEILQAIERFIRNL